jgi:simple sugar transport system permease protein
MLELDITILLAGVIAGAAPIVLAALGETITEKAGLINLSLDGSILLSAMAAFAIAFETDNVLAGLGPGLFYRQPLLTHTGPPGETAFRAAAGSDSIFG